MGYKHTTFDESEVLLEFEKISNVSSSLVSEANIGMQMYNRDPHSEMSKLIGLLPIPFNPVSIEQAIFAYQRKDWTAVSQYILSAMPFGLIGEGIAGLASIISSNTGFIVKSPMLARIALAAIEEFYTTIKNKNIIGAIFAKIVEGLKVSGKVGTQLYCYEVLSNIINMSLIQFHNETTIPISKAANLPTPPAPEAISLSDTKI